MTPKEQLKEFIKNPIHTGLEPEKDELKKLEEEHKKAMEAINAFNKEAKSAIEMGKKNLGV